MTTEIRSFDIVPFTSKVLGIASSDFLCELINGQEIIIEAVKDNRGKYGRRRPRHLPDLLVPFSEITP